MTPRLHSATASAAALGAALLPKCPLCFLAIASAVGLNLSASWLLPLTLTSLAVSLTLIGRLAIARRRYGALAVAALAAAILIAARLAGAPAVVMYGGALLMTGSAVAAGRRCVSAGCPLP
ncbi:MAG TPA: hypothetical protein VGR02_15830 [Thermoanaerobaculia bacterium]|nr:hypothetical protein [Thermoanaerobaculia bacterium]